jgi:hypothetical protein
MKVKTNKALCFHGSFDLLCRSGGMKALESSGLALPLGTCSRSKKNATRRKLRGSRHQQHPSCSSCDRFHLAPTESKGALLLAHRRPISTCISSSVKCPQGPRRACHERNSSHAVVVPVDSRQRPAEFKHAARWLEGSIAFAQSSRKLTCSSPIQFSGHTSHHRRCA